MQSRERTEPEDRSRANLQGGVYGTILATALTAAYSSDPSLSGEEVALGVGATVVVFWVAHAYAGVIAGGLTGRAFTLAEVREALAEQRPMVVSTVPLLLALGLATLGVLSDSAAETLAVLVGVVILIGYGVLIGVRRGFSPLGVVALAGVNALLGLAIVALKALVH